MTHSHDYDLEAARHWLEHSCHHAGVRHTLERGLEYVEAMDRAGIPPNVTCGDELYDFLSDPGATLARTRAFVLPTL